MCPLQLVCRAITARNGLALGEQALEDVAKQIRTSARFAGRNVALPSTAVHVSMLFNNMRKAVQDARKPKGLLSITDRMAVSGKRRERMLLLERAAKELDDVERVRGSGYGDVQVEDTLRVTDTTLPSNVRDDDGTLSRKRARSAAPGSTLHTIAEGLAGVLEQSANTSSRAALERVDATLQSALTSMQAALHRDMAEFRALVTSDKQQQDLRYQQLVALLTPIVSQSASTRRR